MRRRNQGGEDEAEVRRVEGEGALTLIKPFLYSLPRKQQECQKTQSRRKEKSYSEKSVCVCWFVCVCQEIYVNSLYKGSRLKVEKGVKTEETGGH